MIFPAPKVCFPQCQGRGIAAQPRFTQLGTYHTYLARGDQGGALGRLARVSRANFMVASLVRAPRCLSLRGRDIRKLRALLIKHGHLAALDVEEIPRHFGAPAISDNATIFGKLCCVAGSRQVALGSQT